MRNISAVKGHFLSVVRKVVPRGTAGGLCLLTGFVVGCGWDEVRLGHCGNGEIEDGEECDLGADNQDMGKPGGCTRFCKDIPLDCGNAPVGEASGCDVESTSGSDSGSAGGTSSGSTSGCGTDCPMCGDGTVEEPEECDNGSGNGDDKRCTSSCRDNVCGDGLKGPDEKCDDGASNSDNGACLASCLSATCGDGLTWKGKEECDDGNNAETDACLPTCKKAQCGDAILSQGMEECDDGNTVNTDFCLATCKTAVCGDGWVSPDESCDDGNGILTDACPDGTAGCKGAKCGDGIVWSGFEECDDKNLIDDDECSDDCWAPRKVFITAGTWNGHLKGLTGADAKCQAEAISAGLGGTFRAWLSDGETSALQHLESSAFSGRYRLPNKVKLSDVANGWSDLINGTLAFPINQHADGNLTASPEVWTNTNALGESKGPNHCSSWTKTSGNARRGNALKIDAGWTDFYDSQCSAARHLYCFEVSLMR